MLFADGLGVLEGFGAVAFEEGVVFFADAGFEARCLLEADGLALAAVVFFVAAVFTAALFKDFGRGSVFSAAEADTVSAGAAGICLAASRQFGKNSSIRWREIELARRQRGQCAS